MVTVNNILEIENHLNGIKVVVFDLDDTLYSEKEYVKSGYKKIAQMLPQCKNVEKNLWDFFEQKKKAIDELLLLNNIYSDELKEACLFAYQNHEPQISLYSGIKEMLVRLRKNGYLIGIITDGRPNGQKAKIKALGLYELVDNIIITDELGGIEKRKPCPCAFEVMKDHFGCQYKEMVYIGDNINKDFIPCQQLGIKSIYFANNEGLYYQPKKEEK
ncbi:MAG: HAD family hydrolase [Clostridia bacterium]|nr:HAD family hydrolase [Clostridia bacterium]